MSPNELLALVRAQPFRPFRIRTNSGRTLEVRHPEMVRLTKKAIVIFTVVGDAGQVEPDVYDTWETVSLGLIESIIPLDAAVA